MIFKGRLISTTRIKRSIKIKERGRRKNPIAKILRTTMYKSKVRSSAKTYNRKNLKRKLMTE